MNVVGVLGVLLMVASEQAVYGALDATRWMCQLAREVEEEVHGLLVGVCGNAGTLDTDAEVKEDAFLGWCCKLPAKLTI